MTRVQIPAYCDYWMRGDRFGEIVKTKVAVIGNMSARTRLLTKSRFDYAQEVAYVRLDKSGKTVRVILNDCEVL